MQQVDEISDVEKLDHLAIDISRADHAGRVAADLDIEPMFDDVHDAVDQQAERLAMGRNDEDGIVTFA